MKAFLHFVKNVLPIFLMCSVCTGTSFAQDYLFTNYTSYTGTNLQVGASYLYKNVKLGVDARVVITAITGSITLTNIDGSGGFSHALQPVINVPGYANGHVDFRIDFYVAGTSTPAIQTEVPVTPIDVDGQVYSGLPLYEFDEIDHSHGYTMFQMTGSQLNMTVSGGWVRGKNTAAIDYPGIDTAQKAVMFTTVNAAVSSIFFRVGADNTSGTTASRLRSLYFKKFEYPFPGLLNEGPSIRFSGNVYNSLIKLNYEVGAGFDVASVYIERSLNGKTFTSVAEEGSFENSRLYNHTAAAVNGTVWYRLKVIAVSGAAYYSNTLRFESAAIAGQMKVYPTLVDDHLNVQMKSDKSTNITFQVVDYSGQVVLTANRQLQSGNNILTVQGLSQLQTGSYIVVAKAGNEILQQKIMKQ